MNHEPSTLEHLISHTFARREIFEQALTHSSFANESDQESVQHNEQLEFLGDAVLGFVTSQALFQRFPEYSEGSLSKTRAHLVSARHLVKIGRQLKLGDYLRLGRGEERSGGRQKPALLVNAVEALIAALYLDGGLEAARHFIMSIILEPELQRISDPAAMIAIHDQKSALQEWLQATGRPQPSYHVVNEEGPDHRKMFTVEVRVTEKDGSESVMGRAQDTTKKRAEQRAAQQTLEQLKAESL
jgi:ribonuclease III